MWASRQSSGESFQRQARSSQLSFVGQLPLGLSFPTSKMKVTQLNQQFLSLLSCGTLFSNETFLRSHGNRAAMVDGSQVPGAEHPHSLSPELPQGTQLWIPGLQRAPVGTTRLNNHCGPSRLSRQSSDHPTTREKQTKPFMLTSVRGTDTWQPAGGGRETQTVPNHTGPGVGEREDCQSVRQEEQPRPGPL